MRHLLSFVPPRVACVIYGHDLHQVAGREYRRGWCRRCKRTILLGPE